MSTSDINEQAELGIKSNPKGMMQKVALFFAYFSFTLAAISGVLLYLKTQELGASDPVTASFLASFFFCIFAGVCLFIMGNANLPKFTFDESTSKSD
ncbi:hypothetical protein [Alkalimarinus sediminis]|uniref:Uncharacterized protein n=1 Tax=Alkalimarinus sediminis TaxID=1632866 RepID=A0A9E8KQR0_9ALTE|nr:hypothetical protein [Alkalimarinus sediminis]UZW76703.1 hypothetical protein NNL22_09045 [Alkalimarinus sediminis]